MSYKKKFLSAICAVASVVSPAVVQQAAAREIGTKLGKFALMDLGDNEDNRKNLGLDAESIDKWLVACAKNFFGIGGKLKEGGSCTFDYQFEVGTLFHIGLNFMGDEHKGIFSITSFHQDEVKCSIPMEEDIVIPFEYFILAAKACGVKDPNMLPVSLGYSDEGVNGKDKVSCNFPGAVYAGILMKLFGKDLKDVNGNVIEDAVDCKVSNDSIKSQVLGLLESFGYKGPVGNDASGDDKKESADNLQQAIKNFSAAIEDGKKKLMNWAVTEFVGDNSQSGANGSNGNKGSKREKDEKVKSWLGRSAIWMKENKVKTGVGGALALAALTYGGYKLSEKQRANSAKNVVPSKRNLNKLAKKTGKSKAGESILQKAKRSN